MCPTCAPINKPSKEKKKGGDRPAKRLYSVAEAGEYLGLSIWAIRERIWSGSLPQVRDGRRVLLDIQDLDAWIESHKTIEEG